jgi:hypothetical protein
MKAYVRNTVPAYHPQRVGEEATAKATVTVGNVAVRGRRLRKAEE